MMPQTLAGRCPKMRYPSNFACLRTPHGIYFRGTVRELMGLLKWAPDKRLIEILR